MPGIAFDQIDPSVVAPAIRMETIFDLSRAATQNARLLVIGQMVTGKAATAGAVVEPTRLSEVRTLVGGGSIAARMWMEAKRLFPSLPVAILPVADPSGAKAKGSLVFGGTATGNGVIDIDVGDNVHVTVAHTASDGKDDLCAAVIAALAASKQPDMMATVAQGANNYTATVAFPHAGTLGNELLLRAVVTTDGGLTVTATQPSAGTPGTGTVAFTNSISPAQNSGRNYFAGGADDSANGLLLKGLLADLWNGMTGKPSVGAMGTNAAYGDQVTLSGAINAKHLLLVGSPKSVTPSWVRAAGAIALRAKRDVMVSPADAMQWQQVPGWVPAYADADRYSAADGEVDTALQRGITACLPDVSGVDCLVLDVWCEHKDGDGNYIGPQFMTFSGILAERHKRVIAAWKAARTMNANWGNRVVTEPTTVTLPDNTTILQSEQSKAFALIAFGVDKAMENEKKLNFVTTLGFKNYQHQVISYERGQIGIACDVYPAPPLITINAQQRSHASVPASEEM